MHADRNIGQLDTMVASGRVTPDEAGAATSGRDRDAEHSRELRSRIKGRDSRA